MIRTYNKSILIWIIAILAVINISTIGTIIYHIYFQRTVIQDINPAEIDIPDNHLGRFFKDELNLNYDQHQQFRNFRHKFHNKANIVTCKMQAKRKKMILELRKENSDTIYLHAIAKDIGNLHTELKYLTFEYYLEMKNVCSEEQKEKLSQIFNAMSSQGVGIKMPDKKQNNFED